MNKPDALAHFHGEEHYNCAQAVLKTFEQAAGVNSACLQRFAKFGGGRAPGGECGALFAAKSLLASPTARGQVEERFFSAGGSTQCREIRRQGRLSCRQCVQFAADEVLARSVEGERLQRPAPCADSISTSAGKLP